MLSLIQLTSFVAVAEELHFGRAADRLQMTQPPLSRQIQLLERELDVSLFDRSSRSVRLTAAGRAFLVDARRLLADAERSAQTVRRVSAGRSGRIRIGFTAASAYAGLDIVLDAARRLGSGVTVDLAELVTADQLDALSQGTLDLALTRPAAGHHDLVARDLAAEPFVVAVPLDHPLAADVGPITLEALDRVEMIMYSPVESRYFHDLLGQTFRAAGVSPHPVQQLSQIHSLLALVDLGWGVAVVPGSVRRRAFDKIIYRPLVEPGLTARLVLRWRRHADNPALLRLLENLASRRKRTLVAHDPGPTVDDVRPAFSPGVRGPRKSVATVAAAGRG